MSQELDPDALASMEFRRRRITSTDDDALRNLWWQIALGVFLALLAHSLVTGLYARYELQQFNKQLAAETKRLEAEAESYRDRVMYPGAPRQYRPAPLRAGERCISGRRLVRVDNGWRQVMEPC